MRIGYVFSDACPLEDDLPQGSILSVPLFALAINSVIGLPPDGVRGSLYIGDFFHFGLCIYNTLRWEKVAAGIQQNVRLGWRSWFSVLSCKDYRYAFFVAFFIFAGIQTCIFMITESHV